MGIFDGAEDVPFFVAKASWFPLNLDHLSKGTKNLRISVLSQKFTSLNSENGLY
jgi:hypothetical protein